MIFKTMLVNYQGNHYKFERKDSELICQVCYWKGAVVSTDEGQFKAYVEQKYTPFDVVWSEDAFVKESDAINWVAAALHKEETAE